MKYFLSLDTILDFPKIDIEKADFESMKKAMSALNNGLAIEEKYDILISNYCEFEMEILKQATEQMICLPQSYKDLYTSRIGFDRKMVNLLTAAKLYLDYLGHHVAQIVGDGAENDVKALKSKQYDLSREYRFMEALRNHVQHCGLPVHSVQFGSHAEGSDNERSLIYSMELASQKLYLQENPKFKKQVLKEIPDKIDLKLFTRVYIERISGIHGAVRGIVKASLDECRALIEKAIRSYQVSYKEEVLGLYAWCTDGNEIVEKVLLILEWDDVRLKLIRENPELVNLHQRYVTGKVRSS